jgi:glycosyltransferase involved in cell wall biosynthesis
MKILYVITQFGVGGAEKVVQDLANSMNELGHDIKIVSLLDIIKLKVDKKVTIESLKINTRSPISIIRGLLSLKKSIDKFNPDIIHSHCFHANIFSRIANISSTKVLINTAHSHIEASEQLMNLYKYTDFLCNLTTNVSDFSTNYFISKGYTPVNKISTVYNGIDTEKFCLKSYTAFNQFLSDKRTFQLLAVGSFKSAKDYPTLIQAMSILEKSFNKFELTILGDGDLRSQIEDLIKILDLKDKVKLLGNRDDVADIMRKSDIFVLSSQYEGFGLVVAEAMSCGCRIVATDCGGVREIVNGFGKLVPVKSPELLSNAIFSIINEREDYNFLIKQHKHIVDGFSKQSFILEWARIYQSLTSSVE